MNRPPRSEIFMRTAHLFAERSTCPRAHVGAVLVANRRIIAHGYNGAPPGMSHCDEVGCEVLNVQVLAGSAPTFGSWGSEMELGCQRTVHAEANAIAYAARSGIETDGSIMFCTYSPCRKCVELMASAGIKEVVYDKKYRATPWELLKELGINAIGREYA